ncbi:MAG: glycosyltransferase family protein, partial [Methanobacteriota archaeon]
HIAIGCYRGSEADVLDRYYKAALSRDASVVVRLTSDCPLTDAEVIDSVVNALTSSGSDYSSNTLERTYPRGLDVEAMTMETLESAWKGADLRFQREHVTPYIYSNPDLYRLVTIKDETDRGHLRWTVDTEKDLEFVRAVYTRLGGTDHFGWHDVLELVEAHPEIARINAHVQQKQMETGPS